MVDREQRDRLRESLTKLVAGQLTNDEFDECYFTVWSNSADRGVAAVGKFGYGLYSSDLPAAYRLEDVYAVDAETKKITERCRIFLQTDQEYGWPDPPDQNIQSVLGGLSLFLIIPAGAALVIGGVFDVKFALLGLFVCLSGYGLWRGSRNTNTPEWQAYWAAGDKDAWPFLRQTDLRQAEAVLGP